jgi:hypothetical protein
MSSNPITRWVAAAAALSLAGLAAVGVATAGSPATDANGNFGVLDVDLTPPQASTRKIHRGVSLDLHYFAGNAKTGARSPYDGDITIRLPRKMVVNAARFPAKCPLPATSDQLGDPSRCPADSKVGSGTAQVDARPAIQGPINGTVGVFNGAMHASRPTVVLILSAMIGDSQFHGEVDLEYSKASSGPYGSKLATFHPVADPTAGFVTVREIDLNVPNQATKVKVGKKRVRIHLLETPRKCAKAWQFALATATRAGDATLTATDAVGCVKSG